MTWLVLLCAATAASLVLWPNLTASCFVPAAFFLLLLARFRRAMPAEDRAYLTRVVVLAFVLRLACAYLVEALVLIGKHDALKYHTIGFRIAEWLWAGRLDEIYAWSKTSAHPGFYLLTAAVYSLFGPNLLLGQNLSVLASTFTVAPIYFLSREMSPEPRVARLAVLAFAWFPNSIFWSTQLLKDSLIVLLVVTLALDLVRVLNRRVQTKTIARLLLSTVLLAEFRFYLPVVLYTSCAVAFLITSWQARGGRRGSSPVFIAALLATAVVGIRLTGSTWSYYGNTREVHQLESLRASTTGGDSDFAKDADLSSPLQVAKFLPVGAAHFLAGPLPWQARKLTHFLTWLDIPIWYPALVLGFAGMVKLLRRRQAIPFISICLGLTLFYSLLLANLGTAYRMRLQVAPFFLIAAACYWYHSRERTHLAYRL